jgi:hypothetical protein
VHVRLGDHGRGRDGRQGNRKEPHCWANNWLNSRSGELETLLSKIVDWSCVCLSKIRNSSVMWDCKGRICLDRVHVHCQPFASLLIPMFAENERSSNNTTARVHQSKGRSQESGGRTRPETHMISAAVFADDWNAGRETWGLECLLERGGSC